METGDMFNEALEASGVIETMMTTTQPGAILERANRFAESFFKKTFEFTVPILGLRTVVKAFVMADADKTLIFATGTNQEKGKIVANGWMDVNESSRSLGHNSESMYDALRTLYPLALRAIGATGGGYDTVFASGPFWTDFDIKARRKVQADMTIIMWYQTTFPGGTTGADFRLLGGIRTLVMRPR